MTRKPGGGRYKQHIYTSGAGTGKALRCRTMGGVLTMAKTKPPCMGCTDRQVGCHGKCERFRQYKSDYIAEKTRENLARKDDAQLRDYAVEAQKRFKKLKRER